MPLFPSRENSRTAGGSLSREHSRTAGASLSRDNSRTASSSLGLGLGLGQASGSGHGQSGQGEGLESGGTEGPKQLGLIGRILSYTSGVAGEGEGGEEIEYVSGYEVAGYDSRGHEVGSGGRSGRGRKGEGESEAKEDGEGDLEGGTVDKGDVPHAVSGELNPEDAVCTVFDDVTPSTQSKSHLGHARGGPGAHATAHGGSNGGIAVPHNHAPGCLPFHPRSARGGLKPVNSSSTLLTSDALATDIPEEDNEAADPDPDVSTGVGVTSAPGGGAGSRSGNGFGNVGLPALQSVSRKLAQVQAQSQSQSQSQSQPQPPSQSLTASQLGSASLHPVQTQGQAQWGGAMGAAPGRVDSITESVQSLPRGADQNLKWDPPVPCPLPNGGIPKLRLSPVFHHCLLSIAGLLAVTGGLVYLGWKVFVIATHLSTTGPMTIIFLLTEWCLFGASAMLMLEIARPMRDRPAKLIPPEGPYPLTNIFICCCKEPVEIIADTVTAAMHQIYPANRYTVWVLDDGADDDLRSWVEGQSAEKYGHERLRYLRRPKKKGVPHHFKAGNINHGLNHASGEFVAIFDADMIPSPYFLTSMLPHFTSPKIAFVQCPQSFYNAVKGDTLNDTSRDFYDVILPFRDGQNSGQCVGTGAIFRMSILRQNGGFTCGTITEDFDTALTLHSRGYDSVYVNQKLQAGLAAWTFEAYIKQHQRWATGSLQLLFLRKPLFIKDKRFSIYRRITYWWAGVQYYMNLVAIAVLIQPILIVAFDLPIMPMDMAPSTLRRYMILLVPYMLCARTASYILWARRPKSDTIQMRSEQVWYWLSWHNCAAIFKFFFPYINKQFEATGAKKVVHKSLIFRLRTVWFHIIFSMAGVGVVAWQLATMDYTQCGKLLKLGGWCPAILYTVQVMMIPVGHVLFARWHPKPEKRKEYINYTKDGVPYFTAAQARAKDNWMLFLYHIIPTTWILIIIFFFYCAITDYRPPFCAAGSGLFGYSNF